MATTQQADIEAAIVKVARELGVDPTLALADAQVESGFNAKSVGDNGTSFGLFQLHQGGELDSLKGSLANKKTQAFDPETNARVALSQFVGVRSAHPDWTPGQVAAAAQRPANASEYAKKVDSVFQSFTTADTVHNIDVYTKASGDAEAQAKAAGSIGNELLLSGPADAIASAVNPLGNLEKKLFDVSFWTRIAFIVAGFAILLIGISKLVDPQAASQVEAATGKAEGSVEKGEVPE